MEPRWPSQNTGDTRLIARMMLQVRPKKLYFKKKHLGDDYVFIEVREI
jgi:hypothetical protein